MEVPWLGLMVEVEATIMNASVATIVVVVVADAFSMYTIPSYMVEAGGGDGVWRGGGDG